MNEWMNDMANKLLHNFFNNNNKRHILHKYSSVCLSIILINLETQYFLRLIAIDIIQQNRNGSKTIHTREYYLNFYKSVTTKILSTIRLAYWRALLRNKIWQSKHHHQCYGIYTYHYYSMHFFLFIYLFFELQKEKAYFKHFHNH